MDKEQALEKHSKIYEPGTVLFYEGDPASKLWVINEGRIQISKRVFTEEIVLEILGPGEFCGELSLVTDAPQAVTATVIEPARLLVIDATQFEAMIRANGELSMRMMRKLAGRLNEAQFLVSALQMRNTIGRVMLHLKREIENSGTGKVSVPSDLAKMLGLDDVELEDIMDRLVAKKLIKLSGDNVCEIVNNAEYSRYLNYLELRDRYDFFDK
ncbi:MAG: Crp/Fnr family transcriptional regulator [Bradymonadia bacterium]